MSPLTMADDQREVTTTTDIEMPKRFWTSPLGKHDDDWLEIWAWLVGRSKAQQAANLIAARIRAQKPQILDMLDYTAQRLNMTPDELREKILNGEADDYLD